MTRPEQGSETTSSGLSPTVRRWGIVILVITGLGLLGILAFAIFQPIIVLPRLDLAPGFSLVDQNGERI